MGDVGRALISLGWRAGAFAVLLAGCFGPKLPRASLPTVPTELARCKVAASAGSPLVTEWAATEKANLEARMREGGVAVAYSGCAMRILPQCSLRGSYVWQRTTPATDRLVISNSDELYAKLPLGAASLEGELSRSGELTIQTTVSGQMRVSDLRVEDVPAAGGCAAATHLVSGVAVGAFSLSSGGKISASASAKLAVIDETGAKTLSEKSLVRKAGDPDRCSESTWDYPAPDCSSPIQLFLTPLPGRASQEGPPGMVKVDFVAKDGDSTWSVRSGKEVLCTTPCVKWVDPARPLAMRRSGAGWFTRLTKRHRLSVPRLRARAAAGPLQVRADGGSMAKYLGGLMLTAVGAELILAGVLFMAMDCGDDDEFANRCSTGVGLAVAGAVTLVPGIWLYLGSRPRASVVVGPGYAAGTF